MKRGRCLHLLSVAGSACNIHDISPNGGLMEGGKNVIMAFVRLVLDCCIARNFCICYFLALCMSHSQLFHRAFPRCYTNVYICPSQSYGTACRPGKERCDTDNAHGMHMQVPRQARANQYPAECIMTDTCM